MILSDGSIKEIGTQLIVPFNIDQLQPASYDLTLNTIKDKRDRYYLSPREFILADTEEWINMPNHIVGRLEGKSSWARMGLIIHTAGFVDPGFKGRLVLEITNLGSNMIELIPGNLIAQICFEELDKPAVRPYGHPALHSHYQGQQGIVRSWMDHSDTTAPRY